MSAHGGNPATAIEVFAMPIVYIHGVAVRDQAGNELESGGNKLLDRLLESVSWSAIETHLRSAIAPEIAVDGAHVPILQAYWGDLAAKFAWRGASGSPETTAGHAALPTRSQILAELRGPLNQLGARFFGDVFCYLNGRGDAEHPGPIPKRVLDTLVTAQETKARTGEPIVVLTNSMGGQILYDVITYFLPRTPAYSDIRIDFWCSVVSQVGLFEEMKLFLASSDEYGIDKGNRVPFPDRRHLGAWWNVWDVDDVISYSVRDIIEGVDDMPYHVGRPLFKEHVGYLQEEAFYLLFAERIRQALGAPEGDRP